MTYMFILKCALKLVLKNILYYDARSEKYQNKKISCVSLAYYFVLLLVIVNTRRMNHLKTLYPNCYCVPLLNSAFFFIRCIY